MFKYEINKESIRLILDVENFDASVVDKFRESLRTVDFSVVTNASVEMKDVAFIDSSGVGALLGLLKKVNSKNHDVVLENVSPTVLSVLELLRLDNIFSIKGSG